MTESVWVGTTPAEDFGPRMCEVSSVGARQRTSGCSPRGLGRVFALVLLGCFTEVAIQHLFQPASTLLSADLSIFFAGTATQSPAEPSGRRVLRVGVLG